MREVWIFGSYARGALEVGAVDLAVEFDQTKEESGCWFATLMAGGLDHFGALRRELRGNLRALEVHFNELEDLRKEASSRGCCGGAATRSRPRLVDLVRAVHSPDDGRASVLAHHLVSLDVRLLLGDVRKVHGQANAFLLGLVGRRGHARLAERGCSAEASVARLTASSPASRPRR